MWRVFRLSPLFDFDHSQDLLAAWKEAMDGDLERMQRSDRNKIAAKVENFTVNIYAC